MQIELSTLLRLEWSSLISILEDINDQKSNFVEKDDLLPYNFFLWEEGRSFQTWEDGNNWPASKPRFCGMILLKTATNFSNNGFLRLTSRGMSRDPSEVLILL